MSKATNEKVQLRCEKCGALMTFPAPPKMDDYNMILWREEHRQCARCAEMEDNGILHIGKTRPSWNPATADDNKIGMTAGSTDGKIVKQRKAFELPYYE